MVVAGEHAQEISAVRDVTSDGATDRKRKPTEVGRHIGHSSRRGADAHHVAEVGRVAQRAARIAAERDGMVSRTSAEELFMRAPEPKTFVTVESDHTLAAENSRAAVLAWLNQRHPRTS